MSSSSDTLELSTIYFFRLRIHFTRHITGRSVRRQLRFTSDASWVWYRSLYSARYQRKDANSMLFHSFLSPLPVRASVCTLLLIGD
jgi:hypothetical protein